MSERVTPEHEDRVSPYLLRPARTYEEYLRDRETSKQLQERFETFPRDHDDRPSNDRLVGARQGNSRDTANNQA